MSITPMTPAPAGPPPAAAAGATPDPTSAGGFLALVQQALATALGAAPAGSATPGMPAAAAVGKKGDGKAADASGNPADGTAADPALVAAAAGLVTAAVLPAPAPALAATTGAVPGEQAAAVVAASPANGAVGAVPVTLPDAHAGTDDSGHAGAGRQPAGSSDAVAARSGSRTEAPADQPPSADVPSSGSAQPAVSAPTTAPTTAPIGIPAAVPAPAPPVPTAHVSPAHHVTGQVFPEVTSLVHRGDGTHRITLTLNPEALGEVRVVMTVRDGSVHVRLAAGHEAQLALLDGSHELTRLLEQTGASETRVVVRDLPTASAAGTGPATPDLGAGGNRPQNQHAGTRADHLATDGAHDGTTRTTTGADPLQSIESVTLTRAAGVDVTM